ncbi:MAG: CheY-like chemotaxis protein [Planctomycetota bacterium]|jgi:CheY-like chemotaxis protein
MVHEQKTVLVVDDDSQINELVGGYVELAGFPHHSVMNGADALQQIKTSCPALILLDLMLPDVDGLEICRRLHADPNFSDIPIVILTALDKEECRREANANGAVAYLTKPFDPDHLIRAIQKWARVNPTS